MKFRYESYSSEEGVVLYPTLNASVVNPKNSMITLPYKVLVDSGASFCLFHAWLGEQIGIDIKRGEKKKFVGAVEGAGDCYMHPVQLIFSGLGVNLIVGFSYDLRSWFGILGQKGFFEQHKISFDLSAGNFEIIPKSPRKGR